MKNKFRVNDIIITKNASRMEEILEYEDILLSISNCLIKYRNENHLTQIQLAKMLNVNQVMISKLESGYYNPTVKMLHEISRKLNNTSDFFVEILETIINDIKNMFVKTYEFNSNNSEVWNDWDNVITRKRYEYSKNEGGIYNGQESTSQFPIVA